MSRFKCFAVLGLLSLFIQVLGTGIASAQIAITSDCDFDRTSLEVTLGNVDVALQVLDDGTLYCFASSPSVRQRLSTIRSITVTMDDEESRGELYIYLDDDAFGGGSGNLVDWPEFDTFDIDVSTPLWLYGADIYQSDPLNGLDIAIGPKTISFNGTTATSSAPRYKVEGSSAPDRIDGSASTVRLDINGGDGDDVIRGGLAADRLYGVDELDTIYGGGGNDTIDCGDDSDGDHGRYESGWGGSGDDYIAGCGIAGPGSGNDAVSDQWTTTYADLTQGIELSTVGTDPTTAVSTGGAAGDDSFDYSGYAVIGSQGDDVLFLDDDWVDGGAGKGLVVRGEAGDDMIKVDDFGRDGEWMHVLGGLGDDLIVDIGGDEADGSDDVSLFSGGPGNDILRGKAGDDSLMGGAGWDAAWGGTGEDTCGAELIHRCELIKGRTSG